MLSLLGLNSTQFSAAGKILSLNINGDSLFITTNFELLVDNSGTPSTPINYDLTTSGVKVATVRLSLVNTNSNRSREYTVDGYTANIVANFENDMNRFIDNIYISDTTKASLIAAGFITGNNQDEKDENTEILLTNKKLSVKKSIRIHQGKQRLK